MSELDAVAQMTWRPNYLGAFDTTHAYQVTAYFAYANRTVLGLGVTTDGDILGLSPGDSTDPGNWSHG